MIFVEPLPVRLVMIVFRLVRLIKGGKNINPGTHRYYTIVSLPQFAVRMTIVFIYCKKQSQDSWHVRRVSVLKPI